MLWTSVIYFSSRFAFYLLGLRLSVLINHHVPSTEGGKNTLFHNCSIMKAGEEGKMHGSISLFPELSISLVSSLFHPFLARDPHLRFKGRNSHLSKKPGIKMKFQTQFNFFHSTELQNKTALWLKKTFLPPKQLLDSNLPCRHHVACESLSTAAQWCSERNCCCSFRGLPLKWRIETLIDRVIN